MDDAKFSITPEGVLSFKTPKNFEAPDDFDRNGAYIVKLKATEAAGNVGTQDVIFTLNNINDAPTGGVTISGTTATGKTLRANSGLADADGLGALSYQ